MRLTDLANWARIFLPEDPRLPVSISLADGTEREALAREQLHAILHRYDLQRWQSTNCVRIQQGAIPHSHPVLTLNTRHLDDDAVALSAYLHEQLHWFVWRRNRRKRRALRELRLRYPSPPIVHREGAGSVYESHLHISGLLPRVRGDGRRRRAGRGTSCHRRARRRPLHGHLQDRARGS